MPQRMDEMKEIAIGSDHGGYELKELLKRYLSRKGYSVRIQKSRVITHS